MSAVARLITIGGLALAACEAPGRPPPRVSQAEPDGADGLVAVLGRSQPFDCLPDRATWNALVTPAYRDRAADPLGLESFRLLRVDGKRAPITARRLYADDLTIPASLRRVRPAVSVGAQPMVAFVGATALPAIFLHHHGRWRCLVDLDGLVIGSLEDDACRAAYVASDRDRCLDLSAPVASAALGPDPDEKARACARLVAQRCDSVRSPTQ